MYYVDEGVTSKDLISINNTQKNWGMLDYIHYYASLGDQTYIMLEKLCKKYDDIPLRVVLVAISEAFVKETYLKNGNLKFTEKEILKGDMALDFITNIKKEIKVPITDPRIFFFLVIKTYYLQGIDRDKLFNCIVSKYGTENYGNSDQCALAIEHWYNYKSRTYRYISNEILPRR